MTVVLTVRFPEIVSAPLTYRDLKLNVVPLGNGLEELVESQAMPKVFVVGTAGRAKDPPPGYGDERTMRATAYSGKQPGLNSHTALGLPAERGVVAVDPTVVPYGTKMWVEGYGFAVAGDCGAAIRGDRIDVCFDTYEEALQYGWRTVRVRFYW